MAPTARVLTRPDGRRYIGCPNCGRHVEIKESGTCKWCGTHYALHVEEV